MEKMASRVLEHEVAICQVLGGDRKYSYLIPTWQDVDFLQSLKAALESLADFTDMLFGEERVTLSTLNTVLQILKTKVLSLEDDDTTLTKDIKSTVLTYLENKYSDSVVSDTLNMSSYFDPRFMVDYIDENDLEDVREMVLKEGEEMRDLMDTNAFQLHVPTQSESGAETLPAKRRKLGSWLKEAAEQDQSTSHSIKDEMKRYEKMPKPDADSNPLKWWKQYAFNVTRVIIVSQEVPVHMCLTFLLWKSV